MPPVGRLWRRPCSGPSVIPHMDRKSIIVLVVCFLLLAVWPMLVNRLYPPKPLPPQQTNTLSASQPPPNRSPVQPEATPATPPTLTAGSRALVPTNVPEELIEVTNAIAHYTFTSHGGGLKEIE